jgi:Mg2+-importing ATPase
MVVGTGRNTVLGGIAKHLEHRAPPTAFQRGLREFSMLLVWVTAALTSAIFLLNWLLGRPLLESALFALAIAVGLTPQLLPAIVTVSLSFGARRLAARSVLVKRLVSIEDLGNIQVLFTDKTGTLTAGRVVYAGAFDARGGKSTSVLGLGLLCNSATRDGERVVGGNPLDRALWEATDARSALVAGWRRLAEAPFDFDRKLMSVLVEDQGGTRLIVTKGAPEVVMGRCRGPAAAARAWLDLQFEAGSRVVAVATRDGTGEEAITAADESGLELAGFLVLTDPLKPDVGRSLNRLAALGIAVKIITGDNDRVARKVCDDVGIEVAGVLSGTQLEAMTDAELTGALAGTTIFARVTPEQKSRIIRVQRGLGLDVGFLGDGVNDAVALHDADVGISVDSGTDVAKDAADIVLLDKDLDILADGVVEGRRIFSNTIKYVLMGTSSNFGNMFSAAGASLFLPFLPMTPTQILLNNLFYDMSEMSIPTDAVDEEMLARPAQWDIGFIRRFMVLFGPISSIFDFLTFGVMLWVFNARESLFQTGWFVESLATQTLVIFVIRTRRVPFFKSRPSLPLLVASLAVVVAAAVAPFTPVAGLFGFTPLPAGYFAVLAAMVVTYLVLVETAKWAFYRAAPTGRPLAVEVDEQTERLHRRAGRWIRIKGQGPSTPATAPGSD